MFTLVVSTRQIQVSRDTAQAVADHLWKGLRPGAVTGAAKLSAGLDPRAPAQRRLVEFDEYEAPAVLDALDAVAADRGPA